MERSEGDDHDGRRRVPHNGRNEMVSPPPDRLLFNSLITTVGAAPPWPPLRTYHVWSSRGGHGGPPLQLSQSRAFITCFKNLFATFPATVPPSELNLPPATTMLDLASTAV